MSETLIKKYIVRLSAEEWVTLEAMINKGKHAASALMKARILLKADVSEAGEGWSDSRIVKALDTSPATVSRTRQRLVEEGFDAVLTRDLDQQWHALAILDLHQRGHRLSLHRRLRVLIDRCADGAF